MKRIPAEIRTGPAARRDLARDLVALMEQEMQYLGWFLAIVRTYPNDRHNWAEAMDVARSVRFPLQVADTLLRADHTTVRRNATGARLQAAA